MKGLLTLFLAMIIEFGLLALMNLLYAKWQRPNTREEPISKPYLSPKAGR